MKKLSKGYFKYINSPAWHLKRLEALSYHGKKCKACGSKEHLDVHHLTYERFGHEFMKDLTILCRPCHELTHAKLDDVIKWRPKPYKFGHTGNKKVKAKRAKKWKLREIRRKAGYPIP